MLPIKTIVTLTTTYHFKDGTKSKHYAGKLFFPNGIDARTLETVLETIAESPPYDEGILSADIKTTYETF